MEDHVAMTPPLSSERDFRTIWDTDNIVLRDRYSFFHEALCQSFFAFTPDRVDPATLKARMRRAHLTRSVLSTAFTSPHSVRRTSVDLARIPGDFLAMGCHIRGSMNAVFRNYTHEQPAGMILLCQVSEMTSCDIMSSDRFLTSALMFDRAEIHREVGRLPHYNRIEGTYEPLLRTCLTLLCARFEIATFRELDQLAEAARSLLYAQLAADPDYLDQSVPPTSAAAGLMLAITHAIKAYAADPSLSPDHVARQLGISTRYLHKLFQARNMTFGQFLRDLRLDLVRSDLIKPPLRAMTIADIAAKNGFRDATSFHRAFKARFEETPRRMRDRLVSQG